MCEHIGVLVVPKILSQDSVEAVEIVLQERISEKMCEQIGVVEVHPISSQESVKAVSNSPSSANFWEDVWSDRDCWSVPDLKPAKVSR